jgi:hypothetical protein
MPLTGPIPEGRSFFCPHCGALYSVTDTRRPKSGTESVSSVCESWMRAIQLGSRLTSSYIDLKISKGASSVDRAATEAALADHAAENKWCKELQSAADSHPH